MDSVGTTEAISPVADLAVALDLEPAGADHFRAASVDSPERDIVFGGQLAAQCVVAAARAEGSKAVKSVHALFARAAMKSLPLELEVEFLHRGRSLSSATVTARQGESLCARALVLLTAAEPDLIRHAATMPEGVDAPEALAPTIDRFTGLDMRIVHGVDINDPEAVGPAELSVWARLPGVPDDAVISQGVLTHATAGFLIGTAMRPHAGIGQAAAHDKFSTGILGHSVTFHEKFRASEWMLLVQESPYAGNGRSYGRGHAFSGDGQLIASFAQDNIVRHFPEGQSSTGKTATIL